VLAFFASLALRTPFRVDVVRDRASLARQVDDGVIENLYRLQVMNATELPQRYRVSVQGLPEIALSQAATLQLAPAEARWLTLSVRVPPASAQQAGTGAHPIHFQVDRLGAGELTDAAVSEASTFIVPR
jgi:polyferredoxin